MSIPTFHASADPQEIAAALDESGCAVVTDVIGAAQREAVRNELAPFMEAARVIDKDDPTQFYPGRTRRTSALIARSPTVGQLAVDSTSTSLCDHLLLPNGEFGYHLHVTGALEVGPGARKQMLHREHDSFTFFPDPKPNLIVASMWAITDFRADNGATLVVPGSHKWPKERNARDEEVLSAEMPAGSVLYWMGGTLHGAGENSSQDWRYGIVLTYSPGWVRQEENQYLDTPPEVARNLPKAVREIAGYKIYRALGFSMDGSMSAQDI
ncbi:MAG: phytanoyl-CoA dioxygenase family protein [Pseudomonadota bacterium]